MPCSCSCHKPDERNWIIHCDECCDGPVDYEALEAKLVSAQEALRPLDEVVYGLDQLCDRFPNGRGMYAWLEHVESYVAVMVERRAVLAGTAERQEPTMPCPACRGQGDTHGQRCPRCGGSGDVKADRERAALPAKPES